LYFIQIRKKVGIQAQLRRNEILRYPKTSKSRVRGDYGSLAFLEGYCIRSLSNACDLLPVLKNNNLQINTLSYSWHTGDIRVRIEEIDVLQSKHLQDLFSDANSESAFYVCILFCQQMSV